MSPLKRILILNPFGIGDVLFTTPLVAALKAHFPESSITFWCNERVKSVLKDNPSIDNVIAGTRGDLKRLWAHSKQEALARFWGLLRSVKAGSFDVIFDLSLDYRYGLAAKLVGIKRRVGFNYKGRGKFLTDSIPLSGYRDKHIVDYYLDLLGLVGVPAAGNNLVLAVSNPARIKTKIVLESHGIRSGDLVIGIAPGAGASWGKDASLKHWPAIRFAQLADRMIKEWGAKVVLVGDKSERLIAESVVLAMKYKAADLVGTTTLEEIPAYISNFDVLVANDGGLLHMAVAVGIPTVSIFGPVSHKVYGPYPVSEKHIVVKKSLSCQPCYTSFSMAPCFNDRECITAIRTEEVFEAVRLIVKK